MLRHVNQPNNVRYKPQLNITLAQLKQLLHRITTMYRLENYTAIFRMLNITEEDIDYVKNFSYGNLSIQQSSTPPPPPPPPPCYCNGAVRDFALAYRNYHGYVALIVCVFGTVANMLNIVVLTRKDMVVAPINRILTGLATADMLVMLEYIPFAVYKYFVLPEHQIFPYGWAVFVLFHMHFTQLLHTISIALTLTLAVWRYIAIRFPQYNHAWCTAARCNLALLSSFLAPFIACAPSYFIFGIREQIVVEDGHEEILYHVDVDYSGNKGFLYKLNFWVLGVVVKLLPCLILTVISCWLIKALYRAKNRKQALRNYNQCTITLTTSSETGQAGQAGQAPSAGPKEPSTSAPAAASTIGNGLPITRRPSKSEKRTDRTTKMLVAVLLLFLVTEIPQGVLGLLSGLLGDCFFRNCYHNFGEVMDTLALLNGAINFILYCSMSRQFRTTFGQLFKPQIMKKWQPSTHQTDVQSTYV